MSYLASHAHEQMIRTANAVGRLSCRSTVVDQIRLWQLETERMKTTSGFLFKDFDSPDEYLGMASYAEEIGVLEWKNDKRSRCSSRATSAARCVFEKPQEGDLSYGGQNRRCDGWMFGWKMNMAAIDSAALLGVSGFTCDRGVESRYSLSIQKEKRKYQKFCPHALGQFGEYIIFDICDLEIYWARFAERAFRKQPICQSRADRKVTSCSRQYLPPIYTSFAGENSRLHPVSPPPLLFFLDQTLRFALAFLFDFPSFFFLVGELPPRLLSCLSKPVTYRGIQGNLNLSSRIYRTGPWALAREAQQQNFQQPLSQFTLGFTTFPHTTS